MITICLVNVSRWGNPHPRRPRGRLLGGARERLNGREKMARRKVKNGVKSPWALGTMGAIHSTKISGNFGPKLNGSVRSNRKSFGKTGPPFEVVLFSRSDRSEFWLNGSRPVSYQNSSKRQRPFWLLIGARKLLCFSAQSKGSKPWSHFVRSYTQRT